MFIAWKIFLEEEREKKRKRKSVGTWHVEQRLLNRSTRSGLTLLFCQKTHPRFFFEPSTLFILLRSWSIHANQSDFPDTFPLLHSRHESFPEIFSPRYFSPTKKSVFISWKKVRYDDNITNIDVLLLKFIVDNFLSLYTS